MRSREQASLALLAVAVVVIAGCGGGGSEGTGDQGEALTRAEFARAATSMCRHSREITGRRLTTAEAWMRTGVGATRPVREKVIRYMVVAPAEALSQDLERLGPISGGDKRLAAYPAILEKDTKRAMAKPLTVTAGTAFIASDTLANEENLPSCVH